MRVNLRGAWSLYCREVRRYLKEGIETVGGPIFSGLLFLGIFYLALGEARATPEGVALLTALAPGLVAFVTMNQSAEATAFSLTFDRMERIIEDILMAPLSAFEMTVAYVASGATAGLITGTALFTVMMAVSPQMPVAPFWLAVFAVVGAMLLAQFGILGGLWSIKWDHLAAISAFALIPGIFLSGVFVPVSRMPEPVEAVLTALPFFHVIEGVRYGVLGTGEIRPVVSALYLLSGNIVAFALCYRLIRRGYRLKA